MNCETDQYNVKTNQNTNEKIYDKSNENYSNYNNTKIGFSDGRFKTSKNDFMKFCKLWNDLFDKLNYFSDLKGVFDMFKMTRDHGYTSLLEGHVFDLFIE